MLDTLTQNKGVMKESVPRKTSVERERMELWLQEHIDASKKTPLADVITLTPVLAALLLERNPVNRPISRSNIADIGSDIANGRFEFNGESIVVSKAGTLIDGQHRCRLVVDTNTPIQTVIVFGPAEDARYTIDIGRPKSAANFLSMKGYKNAAVTSAAARLVLLYRAKNSLVYGGRNSADVPTKTEIVAAADHLRGLDTSVDFVMGKASRNIGGLSVLIFAHYICAKKSARENADHFFGKVFDGVDLPRGSPMLYCAKRLPTLAASSGTVNNARAEFIFKCWNAWRRGEMVTTIPLNGRLPVVER